MKNTLLIFCLMNILPIWTSLTYSQTFILANPPDVEEQQAWFQTNETVAPLKSDGEYLNNNLIFSEEYDQAPDTNFIGKSCEGGRIFWLDASGKHGLVASPVDQSAKGIAWNPGAEIITGAIADALFAGKDNTEKIISIQGKVTQYAAKLCQDYSATINNVVYDDWYLPSRFELNLLFRQRTVVGGFNTSSGIYWSSTETTTKPGTKAWEQEFKFGSQHEDAKYLPDQVRCIRKF